MTSLLQHKFCILNNFYVDINEDDEHLLDESLVFYMKQVFTVFIREETWERLKDTPGALYLLATAGQEESDCELLTDGEYIKDYADDKFICIVNDKEYDANKYLNERNVRYEVEDGGSTATGFWYW